MKVSFKGLFVLSASTLLIGAFANAGELAQNANVSEALGLETVAAAGGSHWYCVSESPGGMQSSGSIGYGHGRTRSESARRAVEDCGRNGGFGCGAAECFPE